MRISLKKRTVLISITALLILGGAWLSQSRAPDFWGYGKLAVTNGTPDSAVYYLEVRGVGTQPTIARLVKFADHSATPKNALEVSHRVSSEFDAFTQNSDRWNRQFMLLAGRSIDEKIAIPIDTSLARTLFDRQGLPFGNYQTFEKLWAEHVASHLPALN